jgi:histidine triad (HIT) family protein
MREPPADNIFSQILRGELPSYRVYEDAHSVAFLDIFPQSPGHTLVIPRAFSENVFAADEDDAITSLRTVRLIAPAIKRAVGAKGVTVLTNTGKDAGQMVEYLHWHILPRFGHAFSLRQQGAQADPAELMKTAELIRAELEAGHER